MPESTTHCRPLCLNSQVPGQRRLFDGTAGGWRPQVPGASPGQHDPSVVLSTPRCGEYSRESADQTVNWRHTGEIRHPGQSTWTEDKRSSLWTCFGPLAQNPDKGDLATRSCRLVEIIPITRSGQKFDFRNPTALR